MRYRYISYLYEIEQKYIVLSIFQRSVIPIYLEPCGHPQITI